MKKIARKDFKNIMSQSHLPITKIEDMPMIDVYHTHNWDHIIKFWDEDSNRNEKPPLREFYFDLQDMLTFLTSYLNTITFKEAILASLYGGRFVGLPYTKDFVHCVDEMTRWLHTNNMRVNSSEGLLVTRQELTGCIDMISECGFMGMSGMCVFMPEAGIVIVAHHHMNYLIYTNDLEEQKSIIKDILKLQKNSNISLS